MMNSFSNPLPYSMPLLIQSDFQAKEALIKYNQRQTLHSAHIHYQILKNEHEDVFKPQFIRAL